LPQEVRNEQREEYSRITGGARGRKTGDSLYGVAEWFQENDIPVKLLDVDTENKARGSLTHFFGSLVPKVNIHTPAGLDAFVDEFTDGPPVILATPEPDR